MKPAQSRLSGVPIYARLCKLAVSLLASGSALAGAVMGSSRPGVRVLIPWLGVLILACGASALNQVQEWRVDSRMERTRRRPVPSGVIAPGKALAFAAWLITLGLGVLAAGDLRAAALGILAVGWYNGVYTRLKKISAFAAVPGALTGAITPAIGWVGAGGSLADSRLPMICLLLFIWQVPHFWLLLLDRGREYKRAGLPAITDSFSEAQVRRITALWILGTAVCALLLSLSSLVYAPGARCVLLGASLWLTYRGVRFRLQPASPGQKLFRTLNLFLVLVLLVLTLSRLPVRGRDLAQLSSIAVPTDSLGAPEK